MLQAIGTATWAGRTSLMAAATWFHASALRLETTTRAPCSARRSAIALPMPFVEPVTSATFPARSNRVIGLLYLGFEPLGDDGHRLPRPESKLDRLPACYGTDPSTGQLTVLDPARAGGGLVA